MKEVSIILTAAFSIALLGCGAEPASETVDQADRSGAVVEDAASETRYELHGVVVDRDPMANTIKIDHEAIGDWMGAMTMSFPVREADVQSLPGVGSAVTATVHVDGTDYWLTDVVAVTPASTDTDPPAADGTTDTGTDPQE